VRRRIGTSECRAFFILPSAVPHVHWVHPAAIHFTAWSAQLKRLGTAANLTTDAHLAALAIERGFILQTTDADFARFPGLKRHNPLTE
jgi:uncharacterized protein